MSKQLIVNKMYVTDKSQKIAEDISWFCEQKKKRLLSSSWDKSSMA